MGINLDKPHLWKEDIARSVDLYNEWFLKFAPKTYREERVKATPTAPSIARDRLVGLAAVSKSLVNNMELKHRLPPGMKSATVDANLEKIAEMILRLADIDIFPWLGEKRDPTEQEVYRFRLIGVRAEELAIRCGRSATKRYKRGEGSS